jgi:D-alanine-D-alanine ligase
MKKINLLVAFGGQSSEHSISVFSANNIIKAIDKKKYNLILVYIDKSGT